MKFIGNIIWLLLGGVATSLEYFAAGLVLCITIIGIPFALQIFKIGILALWPFGSSVSSIPTSNGCLNIFMIILWLIVGGVWIMLTHLIFGVVCCITIIGIPFGMQHFKLAGLALSPFGKEIKNNIYT